MLLSTRKSHESRRRETDVSDGYLVNPVEVVDGETVDLQVPATAKNRAGGNGLDEMITDRPFLADLQCGRPIRRRYRPERDAGGRHSPPPEDGHPWHTSPAGARPTRRYPQRAGSG